jgi:hypothetical protein
MEAQRVRSCEKISWQAEAFAPQVRKSFGSKVLQERRIVPSHDDFFA